MFSDPEKIVSKLALKEGLRVADFGAGSGFFSKACSPCVGLTGKVFAIEVQKDLVKKLEADIKKWKISNIECIWGDIERLSGTKISDHSVDVVIVANVLFQVGDKLGLCDEVKRVLKKGGRVLVVEKTNIEGGQTFSYSIDKNTAEELFTKRGFKFVENIDAGAFHYGIIFEV